MTTARVADEWDHSRIGPWLIALALSCAVHGAVVWEGLTFVWPERARVAVVVPVDLVRPAPEPKSPDRPRPVPRHKPRPPSPAPPEHRAAEPPAAVPPPVPAEPPTSEVAAAAPVPTAATESRAAVPAPPVPTASQDSVGPGAVRPAPAGPAQAQTAPGPAPSLAAVPPSAPGPAPVTQSARPRGGYQIRPTYPAAARRAGAEGTTLLRVHIRADGTIDQVQVARSAGHAALDEAASVAVSQWRFEPARSGSKPVAVWVLIPVEFRLQNEN